jgi:hypothetical protein
MKKFFFLVHVFAAVFCFGQITGGTYELAGGYSAYTIKFEDDYTNNAGYTFGWASVTNFGSYKTGAGVYLNFTYLSQSASYDMVAGNTMKNGGGNFLCSVDFLAGPVFMLYDSEKIKVPFTMGFHGNVFLAFLRGQISAEEQGFPLSGAAVSYEIDYRETNCGLGFNVTAEYYFSKRAYLLGRIQGSFDFVNFSSGESRIITPMGKAVVGDEDDSGFSNAWGLMPQVGIGIRF